MPLKAFINGKTVISTQLSNEEFLETQRAVKENDLEIIISSTGGKGYLRKSSLGLKHFAHKRGEKPVDWKPESIQHLMAKNEILLGCNEAGWSSEPEYVEGEWIADVMAMKGSKKIAFEVQWSKQSLEETKRRQERYKNSGVRGCWFFNKPTKEMKSIGNNLMAIESLPMFKVVYRDNKFFSYIDSEQVLLKDFIKMLLTGQFRFRNRQTTNKVNSAKVILYKTSCWKCNAYYVAYNLIGGVKTKCGKETIDGGYYDTWIKHTVLGERSVKDEIIKQISHLYPEALVMISERVRNQNWEGELLAFLCPKCKARYGSHYIFLDSVEAEEGLKNGRSDVHELNLDINIPEINVAEIQYEDDSDEWSEEINHWCYSASKDFC